MRRPLLGSLALAWLALGPGPAAGAAAPSLTVFAAADLAFSGGGTTALELCCLGVPTVVVPQTPAERRHAASLEARGALLVLPRSNLAARRLFGDLLGESAAPRFKALHAGGRRTVDGKGATRVIRILADAAR
jgi:spore coat polysaccharide biosynthesis predicted glycosyltransferase SpsG